MINVLGAIIIGLVLLWAINNDSVPAPPVTDEVRGSVRYVVDGDSLYITGHEPQIRLWGVDAPESDEPGFTAATTTLKRLALKKSIHCQRVDTDRYGRTVARCSLEDSREVNAEMINSGTAAEYHRYSEGFYANQSE